LNPDGETRLISHFKGFMLRMKEALLEKKKSLSIVGAFANKFGNPQVRLIGDTIDALLMPDSSGSCQFDKYFSLDKNDSNPETYSFTYPNTHAIFGVSGLTKGFRRHGANLDALDKLVFKDLMNQAGIGGEIKTIEIMIVEKEV